LTIRYYYYLTPEFILRGRTLKIEQRPKPISSS